MESQQDPKQNNLTTSISDDSEQRQQLTARRESMLEDLICPVCMELIFPPVMDCTNGHHLCTSCVERVNKCPQCQEKVGVTRNRFAAEFLNSYTYRCQNQGCRFYCCKGDDARKENHEYACKYKLVQCWFPNCLTKTLLSGTLSHWTNAHNVLCVNNNVGTLRYCLYYGSPAYLSTAMCLTKERFHFLVICESMPTHVLTYVYGIPTDDSQEWESCMIKNFQFLLEVVTYEYSGNERNSGWEIFHGKFTVSDMSENPRRILEKSPDLNVQLPSPKHYDHKIDVHVKVTIIFRGEFA